MPCLAEADTVQVQADLGDLGVDRTLGGMKLVEGTRPEDTNGVKRATRLANAPF